MENGRGEEEDDFQTDEDGEMEVDKQVVQKRKKVCGILCFWNWLYSSFVFFLHECCHFVCFLGPGGRFSEENEK